MSGTRDQCMDAEADLIAEQLLFRASIEAIYE
jgi:hypothetical protein